MVDKESRAVPHRPLMILAGAMAVLGVVALGMDMALLFWQITARGRPLHFNQATQADVINNVVVAGRFHLA